MPATITKLSHFRALEATVEQSYGPLLAARIFQLGRICEGARGKAKPAAVQKMRANWGRLMYTVRRLKRNPERKADYIKFIKTFEALDKQESS